MSRQTHTMPKLLGVLGLSDGASMRRRWLTIVPLVAACALCLAVPAFRRAPVFVLRSVGRLPARPLPSKAHADEAIRRQPADAELALGYAELAASRAHAAAFLREMPDLPGHPIEPGWDAPAAYERASQLAPRDPVVLLRLASYLIDEAHPLDSAPTRSAPQRQALAQADELLARAEGLDPSNAAVSYLQGSVLLSEQKQDQALAALRRARTKQQWSSHAREATLACLKLFRAADVPWPELSAHVWSIASSSSMRDLTRRMTDWAEQARHEGRHEVALAWIDDVMRLGRLMRENGYGIAEVLAGRDLTTRAGRPFAPTIAGRPPFTDEQLAARDAAQTAAFIAYARAHRRPDLPTVYRREMAAARQAWEQSRAAGQRESWRVWVTIADGPMRYVWVVWLQGLGLLVLWLALVLAGARRGAGEERTGGTGWWLLSLLMLFLTGVVAAAWAKWHWMEHRGSAWYWYAFPAAAILANLCWLVFMWVMWRRKRIGTYPACLAQWLPPTLAAYLLLAVLGLGCLALNLDFLAEETGKQLAMGWAAYMRTPR